MLAASVCALLGGAAQAEGRVALLIGNAHYANAELDLRNPANDARALAGALDGLGFEARTLIDTDKAESETALADFARKADDAEVAFFFFAGHGVQIEGENYLLGSGLATLDRQGIDAEALRLDTLRAALVRAQPGLGVIVLDACRNNPFAQEGLAPRGLARVQAQGGSGLLIAYATDPGNVAYDGLESNSLFTSALIDHIATPGLEVRLMFGGVRQDAVLVSRARQVPWVEESVLGEHYLDAAPAEREAAEQTSVEREVVLWKETITEGTARGYRRYLEKYPAGLFEAIASERVARLEATSGPAAPVRVPAGSSRDDVAAALATLGYLAETRGARPDAVDMAYESYARQLGARDEDELHLDAAQFAVLVGAATAQLIRTDLGALVAIETALGAAERARDELRGLAVAYADARTALKAADEDIAAMYADRERVLDRLDERRSYYAELIGLSNHFRSCLMRSLPGLLDRTRGAPVGEGRMAEDAERFVRHATADGAAWTEGSYAWLADVILKD